MGNFDSDKRKFQRFSRRVPVIIGSGEFEGLRVEATNLSLGGILIELRKPIIVGTELILKLKLYEDEEPLKVRGKVVAVRTTGEVAMEFVEVEPATIRVIWKYLLEGK